MNAYPRLKRKFGLFTLTLSIFLMLSLIAAALPQPVQAQVTCVTYHTVKAGDTTPKIAKTYDLKWKEIALANKLTYPYNLKVGQRLCIPPKGAFGADPGAAPTSPSAKVTITAINGWIHITASNAAAKNVYIAKVRRTEVGVGGWHKLGVVRLPKTTTIKQSFPVPTELRRAVYLTVCLKNATTDEMICRSIINR